jgi:hypothetical protein
LPFRQERQPRRRGHRGLPDNCQHMRLFALTFAGSFLFMTIFA